MYILIVTVVSIVHFLIIVFNKFFLECCIFDCVDCKKKSTVESSRRCCPSTVDRLMVESTHSASTRLASRCRTQKVLSENLDCKIKPVVRNRVNIPTYPINGKDARSHRGGCQDNKDLRAHCPKHSKRCRTVWSGIPRR